MMEKNIAILMATYNGEKYIAEQIESIISQTCQDWHLYIHDDGSKDATISEIDKYVGRCPEKITRLDYPSQGGACLNFLSLLEHVDAPYYMFCDQDDVWIPEKVELSIKKIKELEQENANRPVVVCTDLFVAGEDLAVLHPSRWRFSAMYPPYIRTFDDCAPTAGVTGCTMLFNQKAKLCCVKPVPEKAMHDCWICLCAMKGGGILYGIAQSTMYYRQHGDNCMGAGHKDATTIGFYYRITNLRRILRRHYDHYSLLRALGYGSIIKYVRHVLNYRKRIRQGYY